MARPNERANPVVATTDANGGRGGTSDKRGGADAPNPVWFKPIMFGLMLVGLAWIITFYVSGTTLPIQSLGDGNILVGFGILFLGFLMTTRWR